MKTVKKPRPLHKEKEYSFEITDHVNLRMLMRIGKKDVRSSLMSSYRINLIEGYGSGLWNKDQGVIFLISGSAVCTCIPDKDIVSESSSFKKCGGCGALWMCESDYKYCNFCGDESAELEQDIF